MPQITDSRDVYRQLVEESDEDWLYGLLAFAIIEEQRMEWMRHDEAATGAAPTLQEIENWYKQQPAEALIRAKDSAAAILMTAFSESAGEALEDAKREILEDAIITEVRLNRRFWPQFGVSVTGGIASAFVFAALLAILALVVWTDPSPGNLIKDQIERHIEE